MIANSLQRSQARFRDGCKFLLKCQQDANNVAATENQKSSSDRRSNEDNRETLQNNIDEQNNNPISASCKVATEFLSAYNTSEN